eukprot:gene9564-10552_t
MVFNSLFGFKQRDQAGGTTTCPERSPQFQDRSEGEGQSQQQQPIGAKYVDGEDPIKQAETRILSSVSKAAINNAQEEHWNRLAGFAVGVGSLYLQEVVSYPIVIIRRQCQVNHTARKYHLMPFTAFQLMLRIQAKQGVHALWKGWGSSCILQGIVILSEVAISEIMHLPRDISKGESQTLKGILGNNVLKSIGILVTLPFFSANLVDSIQSHQIEDSRPLVLFFKDVFYRMAGWYTAPRGHGRLLPMYSLIAPTLLHGMLRFAIKTIIGSLIMRLGQPRTGASTSSSSKRTSRNDAEDFVVNTGKIYYTQLLAGFVSSLLTELLLYPLETVVIRLHIQGTRTIIDDTDCGDGVVPLCTNYDGMTDCFESICRDEGLSALYKGLGALILQYVLQAILLKITKTIYKSLPQSDDGEVKEKHL